MTRLDTDTLQAALVGCQHQIDDIHARIAEIRGALGFKVGFKVGVKIGVKGAVKRGVKTTAQSGSGPTAGPRRKAGAAGRAKPEKPIKAKRRLSAAGRAAIVAATKKRWAALREEKVSQPVEP